MDELDKYLEKIKSGTVKGSWVEKNLPNLIKLVENSIGESISEKVFNYINSDYINKCKVCENSTKFLSYNRGYRTYCSKKCSNNDPELTLQKNTNLKLSNLEKYGVESTSKLDSVKSKISNSRSKLDYKDVNEKSKKTFLKRYGVDNPSKLHSVKEKKKKTTNINYGVDNPFQSSEIKNTIKQTLISKYGVDAPIKSDIIYTKIKNTLLDKYGFDNPMKSNKVKDKFKSTCIDKYGTEHFNSSNIFKDITNKRHIDKLNRQHYDIELPTVISLSDSTYTMECKKCYEVFEISTNAYNIRKNNDINICVLCNPVQHNRSIYENDLSNYIESIYNGTIIRGYRDKLEIDIFLPELNIGFEFNGIYWHSELKKDNSYHYEKFKYFNDIGINLIQIWEDDWLYKKDIVKSIILNKLNITSNKIYARNCIIKEISNKDTISFLNENHIQGWCVSKIRYGLYFKGELISLMTFGKKRKNLGSYTSDLDFELLRFCNKINYSVIGGASKLLRHFTRNNTFNNIISYSKNDYSNGNLYNKIGFKIESETKPNYYWVVNGVRENRFNWRKDKLVSMGYDSSLTEVKIMHSIGYWRCFDSGNRKWLYK